MSMKRKLNLKTIQDKYQAIRAVEAGNKKKSEIAKEFNVPPNTLSTWLKNKDKIVEAYESSSFGPATKKMRTADFPDVEKALDIWFRNARANSVPISGPILKDRGQDLAKLLGHHEFKCSDGWLSRFKSRHDYQFRVISGEAHAAPQDAINTWKTGPLQTLLQEYAPQDIYNCDETGLFFKMEPAKSYTFKGEDCHGGKRSKERITVLPCANMTGTDKLPLLIIGKFAKPRCFKGILRLPTEYRHQRRAWMNGDIFRDWLKKLDSRFHLQKRKVAMILDNCSAHPHVQDLRAIKLVFLPPNTTSVTQPMDQGIIQNFKVQYRHLLVTRGIIPAVEKKEPFKWTMLNALHASKDAWDLVKPATIANCFRHCGFIPPAILAHVPEPPAESDDEDDEDDLPLSVIAARLRQSGFALDEEDLQLYLHIDDELPTTAPLTDEAIIEQVVAENQVEEEEEEEEESTPIPTSSQAMDGLKCFTHFLQSIPHDPIMMEKVRDLEKALIQQQNKQLKQKKISHFFK